MDTHHFERLIISFFGQTLGFGIIDFSLQDPRFVEATTRLATRHKDFAGWQNRRVGVKPPAVQTPGTGFTPSV